MEVKNMKKGLRKQWAFDDLMEVVEDMLRRFRAHGLDEEAKYFEESVEEIKEGIR